MNNMCIHILTAMTRPELRHKVEASIETLCPYFDVEWNVAENVEKRCTLGACLNALIQGIPPDRWCFICDDDNEIHPDFGRLLAPILNGEKQNCPLFLCRQYTASSQKRFCVWQPEQKIGYVDGGQIVFKAHLLAHYPWTDNMQCPDGMWAETLLAAGIKGEVIDVPTWYNFNNPARSI